MGRAPSLCAVILAAGESSRMGSDKALLLWPPTGGTPRPETFLSASIKALSPYSDMVIVVVGKNEENLAPVIYANGACLAPNPLPERGQFSSLQVGLHEVLNRGRDAAIVSLVDRPPVRPATLEKLVSDFGTATANGKWAVVPEYGGKHGHPVILGRELMEVFLKASETANACDIEHLHEQHITYVALDDPFITLNVDTPQDYANLSSVPIPA